MKLQTQYQSLTSKNQNFSFQFFEWVSIKSRSTYVYNIYINIETGCIGNMSNRICIKSRWQFWMQLYSNCNLITRDPSLPQTSFTLSGDRILSRFVFTAATVKSSAVAYIWKWCYNTFYWQFFFWAVQHLPRVNIYIYAVNEHKLTCCRMLGITNRDLFYWIEMANLNM